MEKKMTYVEALAKAIEVVDNDEVKERLVALKEQVAKRNKAKTKGQNAEQNAIANAILDVLATVGKPMTITQMIKGSDVLADFSTQKLSPVVKVLEGEGAIVRGKDKKATVFTLAEPENEVEGE